MIAALAVATLMLGAVPGPRPESSLSVTASYLSEQLVHPGGQLGIEYTFARFSWLSFIAGANVGGYAHYRYAVGLYVDAALGARATTNTGFLVELLGDVGELHQFPYGEVYEVPSPKAAPVLVTSTGRAAFRLGGTLGLGADLSRTALKQPLAITLRMGAFAETQFRAPLLPHLQVLLALSWRL
jgi:hypothetical protein